MNLELEKLKNELEQVIINPNIEKEKVFEISSKIDKEIEITNIGYSIENKYKSILNRKDKLEIIIQIKFDILNQYKNISIIELEILSNNIYDFCCLKLHQVSKKEISKYVLYKNKCYYEELTDENKDNFLKTDCIKLKTITTLTQKYIKILKNNK